LGPTWNWTVETATHALRIICSGVFDTYPAAMLILGHMGELLPFSMERFDQGWQFYAAHRAKRPITYYLRTNVWITTSGNVSRVSLTGPSGAWRRTHPLRHRLPLRPWACVSAHPRKRDPQQG
jgi:predicted TIM-barrel fold metal-dependent hydrolase